MGAGGTTVKPKLLNLIKETDERLTDIFNYYEKLGKIEKTDVNFSYHSIIILLTLREIENIMDNLNQEEKVGSIKIPQYNYTFRKIFTIKFKEIDFNDEFIKKFTDKIKFIKSRLPNIINHFDFEENLRVSLIDNLTNPKEKTYIFNIIENAYNSNFHKFFIDNYIHDFIKLKIDGKNIYTKEVLFKLKIAKYICQILIFIKLFVKYINTQKDDVTKEELKQSFKNYSNEELILNSFLLYECQKKLEQNKEYLLKDNEKAIDELIYFYQKLLKIIKQIKNKVIDDN